MTLTISGDDYTDRLVEQGAKVSAVAVGVVRADCKTKTYALRDYDNFSTRFTLPGFCPHKLSGLEVVETDARAGRFPWHHSGGAADRRFFCVITCTEPLGLFLDWR